MVHLECDCDIVFLLPSGCVVGGGELAILPRSKAPRARQQLARRILIEEGEDDNDGDDDEEENSFPLDYE